MELDSELPRSYDIVHPNGPEMPYKGRVSASEMGVAEMSQKRALTTACGRMNPCAAGMAASQRGQGQGGTDERGAP
jgi:hypothetical protein